MKKNDAPVLLLLGARGRSHSLEAVPEELSKIRSIIFPSQADKPKFELVHLPYFTRSDLNQALDQLKNRIAILHFAGHSNDQGLVSDGLIKNVPNIGDDRELIYSRHICKHIKTWSQPPALIFLNGCRNSSQVKQFHQIGVCVVIATHQPINDGRASAFAQEFYKSLFSDSTTSLHSAFEQAGAKVLSENRDVRSIDLDDLDASNIEVLDWSPYPLHLDQLNWTLKKILTNERPVYDGNGELVNPYKGLESFKQKDKVWFFGRERLIAKLVEIIPSTSFYTLIGASGSGKSSLISAGVVPALLESDDYLILQCRPGSSPFEELAQVIANVLYSDAVKRIKKQKELQSSLRNQSITLFDLIPELLQKTNKKRVCLLIDQFEELFTQSYDQKKTAIRPYITQLLTLIRTEIDCTLALIIRADFLMATMAYTDFSRLINDNPHTLLTPMFRSELRAAINRPAVKQSVQLEPALIEALLDSVDNQAGSLPLLQYVLSLLWEERNGQVIRLDDYNAFGGIEKALELRADYIYQELTPEQQKHCKNIFLRLVQLGEGTKDTRRRADLKQEFSDQEQLVIKKLTDSRLVIISGDRQTYVEVAHEALIEHWARFNWWLNDNRKNLYIQIQLSRIAKDWENENYDKSWLFSGSRLVVSGEWLQHNSERASNLEKKFINASLDEEKKLILAEEIKKRRRQRLEGEKKILAGKIIDGKSESLKDTTGLSYVLGITFLLVLVVSFFALSFFIDSEKERKRLNYELSLAFKDKSLFHFNQDKRNRDDQRKSMLYYLESEALSDVKNTDIRIKLLSLDKYFLDNKLLELPIRKGFYNNEIIRSPTHLRYKNYVKFDMKNKLLISTTASENSRLDIWDTDSGDIKFTLEGVSSRGYVDIDPKGRFSAFTTKYGLAIINLNRGRVEHGYEFNYGEITSLDFHPFNNKIIINSSRGAIYFLDLDKKKYIKKIELNSSYAQYSDDGLTIAIGRKNGGVAVIDEEGVVIRDFSFEKPSSKKNKKKSLYKTPVNKVSFMEEGSLLAASAGNTVSVWDISSGEFISKYNSESPIDVFSPHPQNSTLTFPERNESSSSVVIWDYKNDEVIHTLERYSQHITALDYDKGGNKLVTSSKNQKIKIWDAEKYVPLNDYSLHTKSVVDMRYAEDGSNLYISVLDDTINIWNFNQSIIFKKKLKGAHTVSFHNGNYAISSTREINEKPTKLFIYKDDELKKELTLEKKCEKIGLFNQKVVCNQNGEAWLYNIEDNNFKKFEPGVKLEVSDDSSVYTFEKDNFIIVKNGIIGSQFKIEKKHRVLSKKFSDSGRILGVIYRNGSIQVLDAKNGSEIFYLSGKGGRNNILHFSKDDKFLIIASSKELNKNVIEVWDINAKVLIAEYNNLKRGATAFSNSPNGEDISIGFSDGSVEVWSRNFGVNSNPIPNVSEFDDLTLGDKYKKSYFSSYDPTMKKLIYDFQPEEVSKALQFIWAMRKEGAEFNNYNREPVLFPHSGYYFEHSNKHRSLLNKPLQGDSKLDQVAKFLDKICAYRRPEFHDCSPFNVWFWNLFD